ncbi:MAG: hypothetical protein ACREOW_09690 [Thermodesulfobacteriota bacterium]
MRRLLLSVLITAGLILGGLSLFATLKHQTKQVAANAVGFPEIIKGEVALVGDDMIIVKEDMSQREYELNSSPDKLKDVKTGYRVEVETANEEVSSLTILGMQRADAELYQKWRKVINSNSIF